MLLPLSSAKVRRALVHPELTHTLTIFDQIFRLAEVQLAQLVELKYIYILFMLICTVYIYISLHKDRDTRRLAAARGSACDCKIVRKVVDFGQIRRGIMSQR